MQIKSQITSNEKGTLKFGLNLSSKKIKISETMKKTATVFGQDESETTGNEIVNQELKRIQGK